MNPSHLGRTRRLVSRAQRRALMIRDRICQHPGCHQTRHLKAHHVHSWAAGGTTDLKNLILLCQFHHTTIHEGGITITHTADGWQSASPTAPYVRTGTPTSPSPTDSAITKQLATHRRSRHFGHPDAKTIQPTSTGEPFNIHECVQALYRMKRPQPEDATSRLAVPATAFRSVRGGHPGRLEQATAGLRPPFAVVDLDALRSNASSMVERAAGLPIGSVQIRALPLDP